MSVYADIAKEIIQAQVAIVGPVAVEQASNVEGLKVDWDSKKVDLVQDSPAVIDSLVGEFGKLFGDISINVCKQASLELVSKLPADQKPATLS